MFDKLNKLNKLNKLKKLTKKSDGAAKTGPLVAAGTAPSTKEIFRSRANYGVNFGSSFLLEKWIYSDLFPDGTNCEIEAVALLVNSNGTEETRSKFESHWNGYMNDDDWQWLANAGVTCVRVPLGYWHVDSGNYTSNTKYLSYGNTVYKNAWSIFKLEFIEKAGSYNLGVIIDIHGLPGGANTSDHCGEEAGGTADFWSDLDAQLMICSMLQFIAQDVSGYDNIAGLQIVNEAEFSQDGTQQGNYYSSAINLIRQADPTIPVIISDGWWPDQWVKWVQLKQSDVLSLGVVVDDHSYFCFSDADKQKSPQQIIDGLDGSVLTNLTNNGEGVDFMIGEYSCVIDTQSWSIDDAQAQRDELVVEFGKAQTSIYSARADTGLFFWTFKFQSGNGGEWDFKTMSDKGAILNPYSTSGKTIPDDATFNEKLNSSLSAHELYWKEHDPNGTYEYYRYLDGYTTAWSDATAFANFNGSFLGRVQAWKSSRLAEHIEANGRLNYLWEWSQGFDSGLSDFKSTYLG